MPSLTKTLRALLSASLAPAKPKSSASATKRTAEVKPYSIALPSAAGEVVTASVRGVEFKMSYCPPGEFWMGSEEGVGHCRERPRHRVKLTRGFWLGQTQVTQGLWERVMGSNPSNFRGERRPVDKRRQMVERVIGSNPSDSKGPMLPVEMVSWFDCVRFCNKLSELQGLTVAYQIDPGPSVTLNVRAAGYRLPTEAEWEYAAKAGTELTYAGGNNLDAVAWHRGNSGGQMHPVGQKQANAWGLYDMTGNVREWCSDGQMRFYSARQQGVSDPLRPEAGRRVSRGGSWYDDADGCRVAYRGCGHAPGYRDQGLGLRLSRSLE